MDLRHLARSPHVSGSALLATQASSAKAPASTTRRKSPRPPPSDIVKNLNYSPNQEIAHLLEKQPATTMHEAFTQPRENCLPKTATDTLGMRHSRRRRDSTLSKQEQPKKLRRSYTEPVQGRRRPMSAEPRSASDQPLAIGGAPSVCSNASDGGGVDFEDLLKDLDQSRNPVNVSKVNNSGKGTVNKPLANNITTAVPSTAKPETSVCRSSCIHPSKPTSKCRKCSQSQYIYYNQLYPRIHNNFIMNLINKSRLVWRLLPQSHWRLNHDSHMPIQSLQTTIPLLRR